MMNVIAANLEKTFSFSGFYLIPNQRLLAKDGEPVHLGSRALDLLIALVANAGNVLAKRDLMSMVWGNIVVEEANLRVKSLVAQADWHRGRYLHCTGTLDEPLRRENRVARENASNAVAVICEDPVIAAGLCSILGSDPGFRAIPIGISDIPEDDLPIADVILADYDTALQLGELVYRSPDTTKVALRCRARIRFTEQARTEQVIFCLAHVWRVGDREMYGLNVQLVPRAGCQDLGYQGGPQIYRRAQMRQPRSAFWALRNWRFVQCCRASARRSSGSIVNGANACARVLTRIGDTIQEIVFKVAMSAPIGYFESQDDDVGHLENTCQVDWRETEYGQSDGGGSHRPKSRVASVAPAPRVMAVLDRTSRGCLRIPSGQRNGEQQFERAE